MGANTKVIILMESKAGTPDPSAIAAAADDLETLPIRSRAGVAAGLKGVS